MNRAFAAILVLALGMAPTASSAHAGSCSGIAPVESECTTGQHYVTGTVQLGVRASFGYTGRLESTLTWTIGNYRAWMAFGCDVIAGYLATCGTIGDGWPPPGVWVEHRCESSLYGSGLRIISGTPSPSAGSWSCRIDFH